MTINEGLSTMSFNDGKGDAPSMDGEHQYQDLQEGGLTDADKDPYIGEVPHKEPNLSPDSEVKALVIGAGIHGVSTAYHLIHETGIKIEDLVIIDRAGGWGGTWYWNRYPGVMCDVEGYSYLPLLEESGFIPSQR